MRTLAMLAGIIFATGALANDTMAELGVGGLVYVRSDSVSMMSEDLYISLDEVRVDYVFKNFSDEEIETVVAFPMPDIGGGIDENVAVPDPQSDNFLNFSVALYGEPIDINLDQRAEAFGVDVTADLAAHNIPLNPFGNATFDALAGLPEDVLFEFTSRGIITMDQYNAGDGWVTQAVPTWTLKSAYWWYITFPPGAEAEISHTYQPSVGGTAGLGFIEYDEDYKNPMRAEYQQKYCMDDVFERAVQRRLDAAGPNAMPLQEGRISYVLLTGNNWFGSIGRFHLTIDKGNPDNLVSFCGTGVQKTGPTTFELTYEDYYPEGNLDVLILKGLQ